MSSSTTKTGVLKSVSYWAHQENGQTAGTMNDVILGYVMAFENEVK